MKRIGLACAVFAVAAGMNVSHACSKDISVLEDKEKELYDNRSTDDGSFDGRYVGEWAMGSPSSLVVVRTSENKVAYYYRVVPGQKAHCSDGTRKLKKDKDTGAYTFWFNTGGIVRIEIVGEGEDYELHGHFKRGATSSTIVYAPDTP